MDTESVSVATFKAHKEGDIIVDGKNGRLILIEEM